MKRTFVILSVIAALVLPASCAREGTLYDMPEGSACVSFPSGTAIFDMTAADGNKIAIELWRGNTKNAVSVPVTVTDETGGLFTPAKQQFDFSAGEAIARLEFTYPDFNTLGEGIYTFRVAVSDASHLSPSGIDAVTVKAQRK